MRWLAGLATLLLFLLAGETLVRVVHAPLPGSVAGMMLLLAGFATPYGAALQGLVADAGQTLLSIMPLLLIPLGVGVITQLGLLASDGPLALVAMIGGWAAATVACAAIARNFVKRSERR